MGSHPRGDGRHTESLGDNLEDPENVIPRLDKKEDGMTKERPYDIRSNLPDKRRGTSQVSTLVEGVETCSIGRWTLRGREGW